MCAAVPVAVLLLVILAVLTVMRLCTSQPPSPNADLLSALHAVAGSDVTEREDCAKEASLPHSGNLSL